MNVNANRLELLRAVRQAASVAPNASPLEVLKGILLKAESNGHLYLSATNLEVAIRIDFPVSARVRMLSWSTRGFLWECWSVWAAKA